MESRRFACLAATVVMGLSVVGIAGASAAPPLGDVVIEGGRIDPALQRTVRYSDLNLAFAPGQRTLKTRIMRTASGLCWDLNGSYGVDRCTSDAVDSTKGQVAEAITRAKRQMAGLPVGPAIAISMVIGAR
ncbi:UrcA family protein [Sphingomonas kaistensis]|uniref:UrcA family protein n=1 Tax=Sphingomonas kaistensis TaxID=298708 RepID=A0A7X5Y4A6_9SPHN|nr:UrcA family protein [Sphingomonas kaistensis]NJC04932.1 UrcA family protein [Sphingomonas kaistensis]